MTELPRRESVGDVELVHAFHDQMPTGVTVSDDGRIFVCYPRWGDDVRFTVAELRDGEEVPLPDLGIQQFTEATAAERIVSVQSVVVDPAGRLWLLDTGSIEFGPVSPGGPKLICVDLERDEIERIIPVPADVALETTYLNDIRFDLRRGEDGMGFITDSSDQGPPGIIVVDLASGRSWRKLHDHPTTRAVEGHLAVIEGQPKDDLLMQADGIAISADGQRLFYCPLASRRLYSVSVDALCDESLAEEAVSQTVEDHGEKGASDTGSRPTPTGRSTRPTTNTASCGARPAATGRSSSRRRRCASSTRLRWRPTAGCTSRTTSSGCSRSSRRARTGASGRTPSCARASAPTAFACSSHDGLIRPTSV